MEKIIFIFFIVLPGLLALPGSGNAQPSGRADAYFDAQQYHLAARMYELELSQDTSNFHAAFYLAKSYDALFRYDKAQRYFAYVAEQAADIFPSALFFYAQSLKKNQSYQQAIEWYERYLLLPNSKRSEELTPLAKREKEGCLQAMLEREAGISTIPLERLPPPVNTEFQEFGPAIYADSLLAYSSSRLRANSLRSHRSGEGFTDQFLMHSDTAGWQDLSKRFEKLNSSDSEATGSFTADQQYYYFTRCGEKEGGCRIYVARFGRKRWQSPEMLGKEINQPGTNSKHPAVSPSGDTLFFASDRRGGQGKTDIWVSHRDAQGEWQPPQNLNAINTSQDEVFPHFQATEQLLFFASNGMEGRGGMDLYMFDLKGAQQQPPIPLGEPFNSSKDDCCIVFGSTRAYLASNRGGNFDIYTFARSPQQTVRQLALGISPVPDFRTNAYSQAYEDVITDYSVLFDYEPEYMSVMQSGAQEFLSNGSSRFVLSADVNDILLDQLRDEKALADTMALSAESEVSDTIASKNVLAVFTTRQAGSGDQYEVSGKIRDANSYQPISAMRLYLLDRDGNVIKITTTNEEGAFRFINLNTASQYQIVDADATEENFLIEYDIARYGDEIQTAKFENIYFDFNQASLRNEAQVALDELADLYRQYPAAVIEINAFTDTTGNDVYNLQLSRDRGLAAFNYLLESGIDRSSLVINARGASTAVSSSNSYVSQQLNRRVEFYITGREIKYDSDIVTRMLRPQVTLYTLSSNTGMPIEDIRQLNGLTGNNVQAYKPIRLYEWAARRAPGLFYQMIVRSEP